MSLASLPADVVWNLTKYVLSSYEGPFRPGDYFWARQDKTRQQRDRESRAANFGRRPRPDGFAGLIFF